MSNVDIALSDSLVLFLRIEHPRILNRLTFSHCSNVTPLLGCYHSLSLVAGLDSWTIREGVWEAKEARTPALMSKLVNGLAIAGTRVGAVPAALSELQAVGKTRIGYMRGDEHCESWTIYNELVRDKFV